MKKILNLIVALIIATTTSFAQQVTATLNHNDTLTTFYGIDALKNACTKAEYGDVISLSYGQFEGPEINKGVTIIGCGMDADTANSIMPTIILNNTTISARSTFTFKNITFESIAMKENSTIIAERCRIKSTNTSSGYASWHLYNCIANVGYSQSVIAINSYLGAQSYFAAGNSFNEGMFENCIISTSNLEITRSVLINCIIISSNPNRMYLNDSYLISTLVATDCNGTFQDCNVKNVWKIPYNAKIFKENRYYELIDEIKNKYKGTDGKELGIYGGSHIFSHKPMTHRITKCEVAPKTTPDGKLSVHIEVSGPEE